MGQPWKQTGKSSVPLDCDCLLVLPPYSPGWGVKGSVSREACWETIPGSHRGALKAILKTDSPGLELWANAQQGRPLADTSYTTPHLQERDYLIWSRGDLYGQLGTPVPEGSSCGLQDPPRGKGAQDTWGGPVRRHTGPWEAGFVRPM